MLVISQTVEDWDKLFNEVKINHGAREKARLQYDHYDDKLEKLVKARNDKNYKNLPETENEIKLFERVII